MSAANRSLPDAATPTIRVNRPITGPRWMTGDTAATPSFIGPIHHAGKAPQPSITTRSSRSWRPASRVCATPPPATDRPRGHAGKGCGAG